MRQVQLLVLAALAAACNSSSGQLAPPNNGATEDPLHALEQETGHPWSVRYRDGLGTPAFLEGRTRPLASTANDAERAGRDFLRQHGALFRLRPDSDDVAASDSGTDELGMTHARFSQLVQGHPVWGGELVLHFGGDGSLVRINGRWLPITAKLDEAVKSADEARVVAVNDARRAYPQVDADSFFTYAPKLYAYPMGLAAPRLAYRVQLLVEEGDSPLLLESFVDAVDGRVLHQADITGYDTGSGLGVFGNRQTLSIATYDGAYWLEDPSRGEPPTRTYSAAGKTRLPGTAVKSNDPLRWDDDAPFRGAAVDAHAYVATAWDYFAKVHGRHGWNDDGHGVHTTVHYGHNFLNAFFNGKQLVFGDGDGVDMSPLSGALDVVAHEFTHGVTWYTAKLTMDGQSGALNEAISDVFACFIDGNWQVGETIYHPGGGLRQPLRDIAHPHATHNPESMAEYVVTDQDNGGVHVNSTIVSHAAYLMQAGSARLTRDQLQRIWYRALTRYLHSSADFSDVADATLAAARDLGDGSEAVVRAAWVAVGVLNR